jgi:hypothetical protein
LIAVFRCYTAKIVFFGQVSEGSKMFGADEADEFLSAS